MADKVIVTNMSALTSKYGGGLSAIRAAIKLLIDSDKKRGLQTRLVALDSKSAMKALKLSAVKDPDDRRANKRAIDGVYRKLTPDYLLILGAIDVVPHQALDNLVFDPDDDPDRVAESDLPYACEAPYGRKTQAFIGPTRVVGRLPDLVGGSDAKALVKLLEIAARWTRRPRTAYEAHFGLSTETWTESTRLNLTRLFGTSKALQVSPPKGPNWLSAQLRRRSHLINCHGAHADFQFYGERKRDGDQPVSHTSARVAGKISNGTVAAVECCYGSQLYDPDDAGGTMGICNEYLKGGAYGFVGSTTISYGPESGNSDADLICQYFLRRVLDGASLGRAFLEARQEFAEAGSELDPFSLKTLAQFTLLGDPSIHPVVEKKSRARDGRKRSKARAVPDREADRAARKDRRRELTAKGAKIVDTQATATTAPVKAVPVNVKRKLTALARGQHLRRYRFRSYTIRRPAVAARAERVAAKQRKMSPPTGFVVMMGRRRGDGPVPAVSGIVAKVAGGRVVSTREVQRR